MKKIYLFLFIFILIGCQNYKNDDFETSDYTNYEPQQLNQEILKKATDTNMVAVISACKVLKDFPNNQDNPTQAFGCETYWINEVTKEKIILRSKDSISEVTLVKPGKYQYYGYKAMTKNSKAVLLQKNVIGEDIIASFIADGNQPIYIGDILWDYRAITPRFESFDILNRQIYLDKELENYDIKPNIVKTELIKISKITLKLRKASQEFYSQKK